MLSLFQPRPGRDGSGGAEHAGRNPHGPRPLRRAWAQEMAV